MSTGKVHFRTTYQGEARAACGSAWTVDNFTADTDLVTCGICATTKEFRAAVTVPRVSVFVTIADAEGTVYDRYEVVVPPGQVNRAGILRDARDMAEVGVTKWGEED